MNRLLRELFEQTWLLEPRTLAKLQAIVERHAAGEKVERGLVDDIVRLRAEDGDDDTLTELEPQVLDRVAVIPVRGVIARFSNQVNGISQPRGTSVEAISQLIDQALADDEVDAMVLDVRSPGGSADGIAELGDQIAAANRRKPVFASVEGMAASAGYWLASQADQVYATRGSHVGSIGVYTVVDDTSERWQAHGIKTHVISTGPHKGAGVDGAEITDEQLDGIREDIGQMHAMFRAAVKAGRGTRLGDLDAVAGEKTSGKVWLGQQAKKLGLIDKIGTMADALKAARSAGRASREGMATGGIISQVSCAAILADYEHGQHLPQFDANQLRSAIGLGNQAGSGPRDSTTETKMEELTSPTAEESIRGLSASELAERCPEGAEALREQGAQAERERASKILMAAAPSQHDLAAGLVADGASVEDALGGLLLDMRERNQGANTAADRLAELESARGEDTATGGDDPTYCEPGAPGAKDAGNDAQAAWDKLSAEDKEHGYGSDFGTFEALFKVDPQMATEAIQ